MYKIFPLSLILRLDAIFTLAGHVQLKIRPIPLFKTKRYQILVSKPLHSPHNYGFVMVNQQLMNEAEWDIKNYAV